MLNLQNVDVLLPPPHHTALVENLNLTVQDGSLLIVGNVTFPACYDDIWERVWQVFYFPRYIGPMATWTRKCFETEIGYVFTTETIHVINQFLEKVLRPFIPPESNTLRVRMIIALKSLRNRFYSPGTKIHPERFLIVKLKMRF